MAGSRIKGITIEIDGNVTPLQKSLDGVNKDLKTTQANLRDVNKLLKLDPDNVDLLRQKQKLLNEAVKGATDRLEKEKEALRQLKEADQTPEVTAKMEALQRQIADDEAYLGRLKDQSKEFGSVAKQQFKAAGEKMQQFGDKVSMVGDKLMPLSAAAAGIGGGLLKLGYDAVKSSDELSTLSKQTGISTDELQKMQYASDLVDVSVEDITGALKKLKTKIDPSNKSLQALGVAATNSDGSLRNATDVFYDALGALSQIENETERDKMAMELFGKSADSLAGIVDDGGAALQQYGQQAEDLGVILDQDTLDALNQTNDTIDQMKQTVLGTFAQVGADVASVLGPALQKAADFIGKITEALRALTPEQTETILKIVGVVAAIGPALKIIGTIISTIGALQGAIGAVVGVLGGPLTIAIGAAVAAGVLIWKNWDKIKAKATEIKDWIVQKWNAIKDGVSNAVNNVKNAVSERWNAMKNAVGTVTDAIKQNAQQRLGEIKQAYQDAGGGIKGIISGAMAAVKGYFKNAYDFINLLTGGKLDAIKQKFENVFNSIKNFVKGVIDKIKSFFQFDFQLPQIKLPHFSIQPPGWKLGDLLKGSIPSLGIEWYAKAANQPYLFTSPTVMPTAAGLKGFGDRGSEIVYGRDALMRDIASATITPAQLYDAMVAALSTADLKVVIGNREFGRILRDQGVVTV